MTDDEFPSHHEIQALQTLEKGETIKEGSWSAASIPYLLAAGYAVVSAGFHVLTDKGRDLLAKVREKTSRSEKSDG